MHVRQCKRNRLLFKEIGNLIVNDRATLRNDPDTLYQPGIDQTTVSAYIEVAPINIKL